MKTPIFIYGAGGLGRELLSFLREFKEWEPAGFIDDAIPAGTIIKGLKVLGGHSAIPVTPQGTDVIIAVGDPALKSRIHESLRNIAGIRFPHFVHPRAILQDPESISIGAGSVITAGCILTCDIRIGSHVLVNLNCTVGHDTVVGDFASLMPGVNLAGEVEIGSRVLIGCGANVINRICVGSRSRIGAGAVIIRDVGTDELVVGVPGKTK